MRPHSPVPKIEQFRSRIKPPQQRLDPCLLLNTGLFPSPTLVHCHCIYSKTDNSLPELTVGSYGDDQSHPSWMFINSRRIDFLSSRNFCDTLS